LKNELVHDGARMQGRMVCDQMGNCLGIDFPRYLDLNQPDSALVLGLSHEVAHFIQLKSGANLKEAASVEPDTRYYPCELEAMRVGNNVVLKLLGEYTDFIDVPSIGIVGGCLHSFSNTVWSSVDLMRNFFRQLLVQEVGRINCVIETVDR